MQTLFSRHQHQITSLTEALQSRLSLRQHLLPCLTHAAQQALLDAYIEGDSLHLLTTNATWASRLRLSSRQLISACAHESVSTLKVHISSNLVNQTPATKPMIRVKPTEDALQSLMQLTHHLHPNDSLAQSLNRLISVLTK